MTSLAAVPDQEITKDDVLSQLAEQREAGEIIRLNRQEIATLLAKHYDECELRIDSAEIYLQKCIVTGVWHIPEGDNMPDSISGHHPNGSNCVKGTDQIEAVQQASFLFMIAKWGELAPLAGEIRSAVFNTLLQPGDTAAINIQITDINDKPSRKNVTGSGEISKQGGKTKPSTVSLTGDAMLPKMFARMQQRFCD